ncbi:MAG: glycosyltransferase [Chloroflexota bacterium]
MTQWQQSKNQLEEMVHFEPTRIVEIDIAEPIPSIDATHPATAQIYGRAHILVRIGRRPIGIVQVPLYAHGLSSEACARCIWQEYGRAINHVLWEQGQCPIANLSVNGLSRHTEEEHYAQPAVDLPLVSVVIPTCRVPDQIFACVQHVLKQTYPRYEIIVVDNGSDDTGITQAINHSFGHLPHVRCVHETRRGSSWARNRGLEEACGDIIAFTDDDVLVDRYWLSAFVATFNAYESAACVTGLILPAELETPSQQWFEQYGGFSRGFHRTIYDLADHRPDDRLYPYSAGKFGAGANMAFRRSVLCELGGFDPVLGAGAPTCGGEDLAAFFEVISRGYLLVYEPGAMVYHYHRRDYRDLERQLFGYGVGFVAFVIKCILDEPRRLQDLMRKIPRGLWYALNPHSAKNARKQRNYPKALTQLELHGMAYGPFAYLRSCWQVGRIRRTKQVMRDLPAPKYVP